MPYVLRIAKGSPLSAVEHDGNFNQAIADLAGKVGTGDARLSDARVPLAHTHIIGNTTGLQAALDAKATTAALAALDAEVDGKVADTDPRMTNARAPTAHVHVIGDVTALQTALDGRLLTTALDIDSTMAADSDTKIATQKATKTALDTKLGIEDFDEITLAPNLPISTDGDGVIVTQSWVEQWSDLRDAVGASTQTSRSGAITLPFAPENEVQDILLTDDGEVEGLSTSWPAGGVNVIAVKAGSGTPILTWDLVAFNRLNDLTFTTTLNAYTIYIVVNPGFGGPWVFRYVEPA